MNKEENRKKLIRELQDLGKLIAPADDETSRQSALDNDNTLSATLSDPLNNEVPATEGGDPPNGPETVDMFVPEAASAENHSAHENDHPAAKVEVIVQTDNAEAADSSKFITSAVSETLERLGSDNANARDSSNYLDELVDELVGAVEKRLSLQSGESLPESLRDELSRDIKDRLSPWWSEA